MANMSYCRFRNTANDLQDCLDNWTETDREEYDEDQAGDTLSPEESRAKARILEICREIIEKAEDEEDNAL